MRTLLGFLMFVMVSGDRKTDVTALLNENVLLPCSCENRNLNEKFQWQKEGATEPVWSNKKNPTTHAGRVETFINNNSSNCSILLKNISEDDNGTYQCIYVQSATYQSDQVNLLVYTGSEPLSGSQPQEQDPPPPTCSPEQAGFPAKVTGIIAVLVLLVGLVLFVIFRHFKKRQKSNETTPCLCLDEEQSCTGKSQKSKDVLYQMCPHAPA